jgi:hypothetical protein
MAVADEEAKFKHKARLFWTGAFSVLALKIYISWTT